MMRPLATLEIRERAPNAEPRKKVVETKLGNQLPLVLAPLCARMIEGGRLSRPLLHAAQASKHLRIATLDDRTLDAAFLPYSTCKVPFVLRRS